MATENLDDAAPEQDSEDKPFQVSQRTLAYIKGESLESAATPAADAESNGEAPADDAPAEVVETAADEPQLDGAAAGEAAEEVAEAQDSVDPDEPPAPWFDDRDKQYAESFGLTDYDLALMGGRDELLRATNYIARVAASLRQPQQAPVKAAEPEAPVDGPFNKDGTVNAKWCEDHDLDAVQMASIEQQAAINKSLAEVSEENKYLRSRLIQDDDQRLNDAVHDAIDKLDRPELFGLSVDKGRPVEIAPALFARRNRIFGHVDAWTKGYRESGAQIPPLGELVSHAASLEFAKDLATLDAKKQAASKQQRLEAIAKQSTRRRPVAAVAGATSKQIDETDPNSSEAILRTPAFAKWRREKAEQYGESVN